MSDNEIVTMKVPYEYRGELVRPGFELELPVDMAIDLIRSGKAVPGGVRHTVGAQIKTVAARRRGA